MAKYDRNGTKDRDKLNYFTQLVDNIGEISCNVEPSSHTMMVTDRVLEAAVEAFPLPRRTQKKEQLSQWAFDIVCERKDVLMAIRDAGRRCKQLCESAADGAEHLLGAARWSREFLSGKLKELNVQFKSVATLDYLNRGDQLGLDHDVLALDVN